MQNKRESFTNQYKTKTDELMNISGTGLIVVGKTLKSLEEQQSIGNEENINYKLGIKFIN